MSEHNKSCELPDIQLPTENGKLLALPDFTEEHGEFEDAEDQRSEHLEVIAFINYFFRKYFH